MNEGIETIIIGGGQAGLATSYYLSQAGREHLILEASSRPAHAWREGRWDSFTFVTPNWTLRMPGMEYSGDDREGFMPREKIIGYFEQYVEQLKPPIQYRTRVASVEKLDDGYRVDTGGQVYEADNVVVATGLFQKPKIPAFSADAPVKVVQMHSSQYRNPASLPPGAILVIGAGQSGAQIAEELYQSGRKVYLSVGRAGRAPSHYRGKDTFEWLNIIGFMDRTVDRLPNPKIKFAPNPQLSGKNGGHTLNLYQFARDGVTLLGRIAGIDGNSILLKPDLKESLAASDKFEADAINMIDGYIQQHGLDAPEDHVPDLSIGFEAPVIEKLDLKAAGISSIIWANGYGFDFSLVKLPVFDQDGFPVQTRGVAAYPGLYFIGLPWLWKPKSGLLLGIGDDAAYITEHITERIH